MKLTNKYNLPAALVRAVDKLVNEPHNAPGCYSVTTLGMGIKEVQLIQRHFDEIEVDVSKELWAVFGTAIHALLEREARVEDGTIAEYCSKFQMEDGGFITGKADLINEQDENGAKVPVLEDYKTTKATALLYDTPSKWRKQMAGYLALLEIEGLYIRKARIYAMLKDWSEPEAKRSAAAGYPQAPIVPLTFEYKDEEIVEALDELCEKYWANKDFEKIADDDIPPCTDEERWAKESRWAIMKAGATKATKLCDTREEAQELIRTKYGPQMYGVEERPSEDTKCLYYCKAAQFCSYYKSRYKFTLGQGDNKDDNQNT